jgi:hypothetical protein
MTAYYGPYPSLDFLTSRFLRGGAVNLTLKPQPGGPGLRICDPRRQGDPAIPPGTRNVFYSPFTTSMSYVGAILILRAPHGDGDGLLLGNNSTEY